MIFGLLTNGSLCLIRVGWEASGWKAVNCLEGFQKRKGGMSLWATAVHYKSYAGGEVGREKSHLRSRCVEASGGWHSSGTKDLMKKEGMTSSFSGTDLFGTMGQKQPSWTENRKKKKTDRRNPLQGDCAALRCHLGQPLPCPSALSASTQSQGTRGCAGGNGAVGFSCGEGSASCLNLEV